MSGFTPASPVIASPDRPDHLAGAVLHALSRPLPRGSPNWGLIQTLILGLLSFGLWPLLAWPGRFREFVSQEQQQLWHLGEWLRLRSGRPEAAELRTLAGRIQFRMLLWLVPLLLVAIVAAAFLAVMWTPGPRPRPVFEDVLAATYWFGQTNWIDPQRDQAWRLFLIWNAGLAVAYLCHWLQIMLHQNAVRRFVDQFNRVAGLEGLPLVAPPRMELGLRPTWLLAAAVLLAAGVLWGLPMLLAGAAQRRYINGTNRLRPELSRRVRELLHRQRPAMDVPTPVHLREHCAQELCRATLPTGARFCPRCGMQAHRRVEAVA